MENEGCYELIVQDSNSKELIKQTYPLDSLIVIIEKTYPKELDGWCRSKMLFSNLSEEKKSEMLEHLTSQNNAGI